MTKPILRMALWSVGLLLTAATLTGCLKDGDDTIVLPLPDGKIPYSVIPSDLQDSLRRNGFIINEGLEPPTINGKYLGSPILLDHASDGVVLNFVDVEMTFSKQLERGLIKYVEKQITPNGGSMTSEYEEANIIGSGNRFTVYCNQTDNGTNVNGNDWSVKITKVISGTWTAQGIKDCQYAWILREKVNDEFNRLPATETFRIYHDGDNMAVTLE